MKLIRRGSVAGFKLKIEVIHDAGGNRQGVFRRSPIRDQRRTNTPFQQLEDFGRAI
jgi:hypothetical protein